MPLQKNRKLITQKTTVILAFTVASNCVLASNTPTPMPESGFTLDLRYRYENVDDAAYTRDANAQTVRLQVGYRWVFASNWLAYVQGERVQALFGQDYNNTANGKTQYPVIADPQSTEINQAYVDYFDNNFDVRIGRQAVSLDNQRFFGNVNWRQNEQTFDAASVEYKFDTDTKLRYFYLNQVLRTPGHDHPNPLQSAWDLNGHLINISQTYAVGALSGYGYFVENQDIPSLSTRTVGLRYVGKYPINEMTFGWSVEYADQRDWDNNPHHVNARYWLIEPAITCHDITFKAGWEVMGGDGHYGFSTPYATLHIFDGWADRLTTTPVNGIDDRYLSANGVIHKASWNVAWHDFQANHGNHDYGHEFDASINYPLYKNIVGQLAYANYHSDGFSSDEQKIWASLEYKF